MSDKKTTGAGFDFMDPWRGMREAYMETWSKGMIEAVNSDQYAAATGTMLDAYLTASAPFREAVEKAMAQALEQLNLPSRSDLTVLAERLTNVEMRIDDLDAAMHRTEVAFGRSRGDETERRLADVEAALERIERRIDQPAAQPALAAMEKRLDKIEAALHRVVQQTGVSDSLAAVLDQLSRIETSLAEGVPALQAGRRDKPAARIEKEQASRPGKEHSKKETAKDVTR